MTAILLIAGLYIILSSSYSAADKHWAYGIVGTLVGFWLRPPHRPHGRDDEEKSERALHFTVTHAGASSLIAPGYSPASSRYKPGWTERTSTSSTTNCVQASRAAVSR